MLMKLTPGKTDEEKKELMRQIEGACLRFDRSGTNSLTVDQVNNLDRFL